jgi:hypothetical protein
MRYRLMATYRGVAYEAGVGPTDKDIVLFAACPPPEELGFQPATGHWRKAVSRAEVDAVWESRPSGTFRGEPCLVLDDLGEHLHISYLGHHPSRAERLGYSQTEPGVFELLAAREDVTGITEDRVDHAFLPWQQGWPAVPAAPGAAGPDWPEPMAAGTDWPDGARVVPIWNRARGPAPRSGTRSRGSPPVTPSRTPPLPTPSRTPPLATPSRTSPPATSSGTPPPTPSRVRHPALLAIRSRVRRNRSQLPRARP